MSNATIAYDQVAAQSRRDELILAHLPLVRHVIAKLVERLPPHLDVENLESAGVLGLVEAARTFDPGRGTQFKTHAFARVRGAVLDEMRRNSPLPQQMLQQVACVRRAYAELKPPVTIDALASATGLTCEEVTDCLAALRLTRMGSLDVLGDVAVATLTDRQELPSANLERLEDRRLLTDAIEALPERERLVVTLYYLEDLRLKEIGSVLHLSESRVSRILSAALLELGEYIRSRQQD